MDLQELKQKWNILDERLSTSDVYNQPMLTEIVRRKNKTSYKEIRNGGLINLFTALFFAAVLVPIMHVKGICHDTSFYILEGVCLLCVLMAVCRLWIISRFNVLKSPQHQLHNLINYKRCYAYETVLGIPLAGSGIFLSICLENVATPTGYFFIALGILMGISCGWMGWIKHKTTMQRIERNLEELNDFKQK